MTIPQTYVGCDVSKAHLDLFHSKTERLSHIANTPEAIDIWLDALPDPSIFIVLEATGVYDRALRERLHARNIPFARMNPDFTHHFGRSKGKRAKTDKIDARMLAEYGTCHDLTPHHLPSQAEEHLCELRRRRDQLVDARAKEKIQMEAVLCETIARSHRKIINMLSEEIAQIERQISEAITRDCRLAERARRLETIPGIGKVTTLTLLSLMPELGTMTAKKASALAGVAPYDQQSGNYFGQRKIEGGRHRVRKALYMAALSATRGHNRFAQKYQQLISENKPKKVALIAIARKILITANAITRDQCDYKN